MSSEYQQKNKINKKGKVFQAPFLFHILKKNNKHSTKGMSPVILNGKSKASMTVEAALVIPMFLFASLMILSLIDMMNQYMSGEKKIHSLVREGCVMGAAKSGSINGQDGDLIRLNVTYPVSPTIKGPGYRVFFIENHCMAHIFNGYGIGSFDVSKEGDMYVYVTKTGSVYHKKRSCKYINVSIQEAAGKDVSKKRNLDGGKYYPCSICAKKMTKKQLLETSVYIADYGTNYHTKINCSDLKRTVEVIPLSKAGKYRPCSGCGG